MDNYYPLLSAPDTFWTPTLVLAGMFAIRYLLFAGIAWGLGYRCAPSVRRRKLQPALPHASQIRRELGYSALAVALFGVINGALAFAGVVPHTQVYRDIAQHGWIWFAVSIVAALVVHDTYFYWTHRLLHVRSIFPVVHRVHHLSTNPTPWTAYAFHPLESIVQAGGVIAVIFVVPIHPLALILFQAISTAVNVYGHSGFELYPPGFSRHWLGRWINTSVAHNAHHATARHNYGLYFLVWDRLLGTVAPDYDRRYDEGRPPALQLSIRR